MRVLILHSELGVLRGGGENFTRNLFTIFSQRGHRVAAAFAADRNGRYPIALPAGIEPIPIAGWWSSHLGQAILSRIGRHIPATNGYRKTWDHVQEALSWRVFRWHKLRFQNRAGSRFFDKWNDYDAVYVHGDSLLASVAARHRPTVLRLPGPVTAELGPTLRTVHAVCANGDALQRVRAFLGDHATELPVGVDVELFRPGPSSLRSALGWTDRQRVLGYVGRLTHLKGVDLLAAAFRDISRADTDARLLIVGSGAEEKSLRSTLAQEISRGIVHLVPDVNHDKLADCYGALDLLVMPSRYENFSNALLEGAACGIPFLASDVGGNRMLGATGSGWLYESESVSALVQCAGQVLKDKTELMKRGKIGCDYARTHHSWTAAADRLEEIFRSTVACSHA
jgi:glycosyltransferase involved in cell wall biosynthesis